ncbi:unnamed protein product, partial [Ectocarpus fasciculatus]
PPSQESKKNAHGYCRHAADIYRPNRPTTAQQIFPLLHKPDSGLRLPYRSRPGLRPAFLVLKKRLVPLATIENKQTNQTTKIPRLVSQTAQPGTGWLCPRLAARRTWGSIHPSTYNSSQASRSTQPDGLKVQCTNHTYACNSRPASSSSPIYCSNCCVGGICMLERFTTRHSTALVATASPCIPHSHARAGRNTAYEKLHPQRTHERAHHSKKHSRGFTLPTVKPICSLLVCPLAV